MFDLNGDSKKIKTKVLVMSGISLFIALTQALPQKVAILGLDLSKNETMAGWFVLAITAYFLISFIVFSIIEIIQYYLPTLIGRKTAKTTGDTIGLTADECFPDHEHEHYDQDTGTTSGEINDIKRKNQEITYKYKSNFVRVSNFVKLATDFVFPIVFSFISLKLLSCFLISLQ
jgi:zinc transporter ZupT